MLTFKPDYFDRFRCIADKCPDSCCKEWEVQVDDDAAAYYRSLPGSGRFCAQRTARPL